MKKKFLTLIASVFFVFFGFSQNQQRGKKIEDTLAVKHFAIGLKLGIPNLAAGTTEVVLPLFKNHFALYTEYSQIKLKFSALETTTTYSEYGMNYYFKTRGNGFFVGLGKGILSADILFKNLLFINGDINTTGTATTLLDLNTTHIKLGINTAGTIYFRCEIGYGRGKVPDRLLFSARSNGITKLFDEALPPLPGLGSNGLLIGPSDLVFHYDFKKYKPYRESLILF